MEIIVIIWRVLPSVTNQITIDAAEQEADLNLTGGILFKG